MLSQKKRLNTSDVEKVLKKGLSAVSGGVRVKALPREKVTLPSRGAIIVSKKVTAGSAVKRNLLRRQAYAIFSRLPLRGSFDVAITLTKAYKTAKEMEADIKEALLKKVI